MLTKKFRTLTCYLLCFCMIMLNASPLSAGVRPKPKPKPGDKIPPKERPERQEMPEKPDKMGDMKYQKVIEYVKKMKTKDAFIPIIAQLAQRNLSGVSDKNELDLAFEKSLAKSPGIKKFLPDLIEAYNAIPENLKRQKFVMPDVQKGGKASTAAINDTEFESMLKTAYPDKVISLPERTYQKKKMINKDFSNLWKDEPFGNIQAELIEYVEKPRITHLTPTGREPGESIHIYGMHFQTGETHKVILTYQDVENSDPEYYEEVAVASNQIDFDIPNDLIPGTYKIQVQAPGMIMAGPGESSLPLSDPGTYEVGIPKYKVYFTKMKCIDETRGPNNENIYNDSLVTFWGIGADERGWFKHSKKYEPFEDGTNIPYDGDDQHVLTPGDNWNKVQYGLVISVDLYEWNWTSVESGDSDAILDWAYCFFEEMSSNHAWEIPIINELLDLIALLLTPLVDLFVNLFTADPRHIENETIEYTAMDLQTMLNPGESETKKLNFKGQDGEYELSYIVRRK